MIQQHSAGVVLFFKTNNKVFYLLLHNVNGHWDFPKGKIEKGETQQQAALRELYEEAGIHAQLLPGFQHSLSYFFKESEGTLIHKTVTYFIAESPTQKVVLSDEHTAYEWVDYKRALIQVSYKNAQELLAKAHTFLEKN